MAWLIFLLFCIVNTGAQLSAITDTSNLDLEKILLTLLLRLQHENFFDTLLIYGEDCVFPSLSRRLPVSTVLASSGTTDFDWNYSSLTLILSCGFEAEKEENYRTLMKLQTNRRLILLQEDIQPESVCNFYSKKEQYNIAMVKENFPKSGLVYSCRLFQDQNYEKVNIFKGSPIFINQFRNMRGAPIRTITDDLAPRSMVTLDPKTGEKKWIGYVANLLNNFIKKVNATMVMQVKLNELEGKIFFVNISKWTANDLLDIGMSVDTTWEMDNFDTFTYPYLMCSYCFMIPLPDEVPYNEVFAVIIYPSVLVMLLVLFCVFSVMLIYIQQRTWRGLSLTSILMNDMCLRGFLGQPFPFPRQSSRKLKLICLLLCFASLMITTMYGAYLKTFLFSPPPKPMMRTFSDLEKSRYKVAMNWAEMDMLRFENDRKLQRVSNDRVEIFEDYHQFVSLRESFNDNYIFPVNSLRWETYNEQQKLFHHRVFYYSNDFCLTRYSILSFPIRRHLPYRDLFEEHILRQKEFGLLKHWMDRSFLDMLRLKLTPYEDFSAPPEETAIYVDDLYWILGIYAVALSISCCCFALELLGSLSWWKSLKKFMWRGFKN
ncbi:uncharacterized protein LOC108112079 [Drosophila eugracilis]|uniref:uncharacterized protein LOC108112079 n=1 Tax=Drosophila eugracilis TaxID=29029 RepID=UPI0007E6EFE3|nr:uncharacterized protein LOC108112079 [Drosophila eugracilis]